MIYIPLAMRVLASLALSASLAHAEDAAQVSSNYSQCLAYLEELRSAFGSASSLDDVKSVAYDQYITHPIGPYTFCWNGVQSDDRGKITLEIHPYLEEGATLQELWNGKDPAYEVAKLELYRAALKEPTGKFFNYTEYDENPLSQTDITD